VAPAAGAGATAPGDRVDEDAGGWDAVCAAAAETMLSRSTRENGAVMEVVIAGTFIGRSKRRRECRGEDVRV
jgi:hypothetical protein